MSPIKSRVILHFPGFEPLSTKQHRDRFERAANQTADIWNVSIKCNALYSTEGAGQFDVNACGQNWTTTTHYYVLDLTDHIEYLLSRRFLAVLTSGYAAFLKVIVYGGTWNYLRHAWRFGLFSIFPFLFMAIGISLAAFVAMMPMMIGISIGHLAWTIPLALTLFFYGFMPLANRLHTMLLFSDWKCAVDFATLNDTRLNARLDEMLAAAKAAFRNPADEYLIVSHSIGGNAAVHVIGRILEEEPQLLHNKSVIFASVGSGILQGALLRPARSMRVRAKLIATCPQIFWFDVQCLTDTSNFYKTKVAQLCGYRGERQPTVSFIRIKTMLSEKRYARIKRDLLRVHRQYVLGNDVRANYDYALMCAGPLPATSFAELKIGEFPAIDQDGSIKSN